MCFWKFELQPQNLRFFSILSDYIASPKWPLFKILSFLNCLFVVVFLLHRIRLHVVLVVDGVEHQVDVIMAVFSPTPDKRPEFFSVVQIYDFIIYCKSALEFVKMTGRNISVRTFKTRGTQGHQK